MKDYWNGLKLGEKIKFVSITIVVLLVLLFTLFNWYDVELHFVFFEIQIPLTVVIIISLGAGYLASTLFEHRKFKKRDREIRLLKKQLKERP